MITEREKQLARREGFIACFNEANRASSGWGCTEKIMVFGGIERHAADRYPLPKIPEPRVVVDSEGDGWRWFDGRLQMRRLNREIWGDISVRDITDASRHAVAKVLLDPIVWIEDPGPTLPVPQPPPVRHSIDCAKSMVRFHNVEKVNCTCGAEAAALPSIGVGTVPPGTVIGVPEHLRSYNRPSTESSPDPLAKAKEAP